jgi:2-dehydropantoate 2-reductase
MRIAVMAAGAVGGYFGGRLAAAGHDVVFFARGAHLDAIRKIGLQVKSIHGDFYLKDANATDATDGIAPVDAVLFAVKLWDSETAAQTLRPLIGASTRVITLQNGIDSVERIEPILGEGHVVPGMAQIASVIAAPGVISHTSHFHLMRFNHSGGRADATLSAFVEAAKGAGLDVALSDDIDRDLWTKFVYLVGLSSITATTRLPIGQIRNDPDTRAFLEAIMREVVTIARRRGAALPEGFEANGLAFIDNAPVTMKASMAHDLERGNRLELDWLAGKVSALGKELGIPTPANDAVYAVLKPYRMGKALL